MSLWAASETADEATKSVLAFSELPPAPAYLGVVAESRPWRDPEFEVILEAEERMPPIELPPGRYRVVCAARGHAISFGPVIELEVGRAPTYACQPEPLVSRRGRVVDETGMGLSGVSVGRLRSVLRDFRLQLSPMGEQFAEPWLTSSSDADGWFEVRGLPGFRATFWAEKPGRAPQLLADVPFPEDAEQRAAPIEPVALLPGSSLRLTLAGLAPEHVERYFVELLYEQDSQTAAPSAVTRVRERALDLRGVVEWAALPAGVARVRLRGAGKGVHDHLPIDLGTVMLSAGQAAALAAKVPPLAPETKVPGRAAAISLLLSEPFDENEDVRVEVAIGRFQREVAAEIEAVSGGTLLRAPTCRPGITLVIHTESRVSEPITVAACREGQLFESRLHPAAALAGRLVPPLGAALAPDAELHLAACARDGALSRALWAYPITVANDGAWTRRVPAGCALTELVTVDFAVARLGEIVFEPGAERRVGDVELGYGGSILVRLADSAGLPLVNARVAAIDAADPATVQRSVQAVLADRNASLGRQELSSSEGWVRLAGLPPAAYHLAVLAEGLPPFLSDPVFVTANLETVVETLEVPPSAELRVSASASEELVEVLDEVEIHARGHDSCGWLAGVEMAGKIVGDDEFTLELPPGTWQITALAVAGGFRSPAAGQIVELAAGESRELVLELDQVAYRGRVTRARQAVEATLAFRPARSGGQYRARSDENGDFVLLARPGLYDVAVSAEGSFFTTIPEVTLDEPHREVALEIPGGAIEGIVVGETGAPVAGARVSAERAGAQPYTQEALHAAVRSTESGSYALTGLEAGRWAVRAVSGGRGEDARYSSPLEIFLERDELRAGVELMVKERGLKGRLVDVTGRPLPAAQGRATILAPVPGEKRLIGFRTGQDGRFELSPPPRVGATLNFEIFPTDAPATALQAVARPGMELRLGDLVGTELTLRRSGSHPRFQTLKAVAPDGSFLSLWPLRQQVDDDVIVFAPLGEGAWRLVSCESSAELETLFSGSGHFLPELATVEATFGSPSVIDLKQSDK